MQPWWDSAWLWSGVGIVVVAAISAIVAVLVIAFIIRGQRRRS